MINDYELMERRSIPTAVLNVHNSLIAMMVFSMTEAAAALTASIKGCHFVCLCCRNCCCEYDVTTTEQVPLFS
jgi:hypothetical protein